MKNAIHLGRFEANVDSISTGKAGSLEYIEVKVNVWADALKTEKKVIAWRGGWTGASIRRTIRALVCMGIHVLDHSAFTESLKRRPLTSTIGGSFYVSLFEVECDVEETHGKQGVVRTFIHDFHDGKL